MYVRARSKDNSFIPLKVSETSKRCNGRPVKYKDQQPSFRDDCGLLKVDANNVKYFQVLTTNINLHYFYLKSTEANIPAADALHPLAHARHGVLRQILRQSWIFVHKLGASTDLTTGYLVRTQKEVERWYVPEKMSSESCRSDDESSDESDNESNAYGDLDEEEWLDIVQWGEIPFPAPGDSGSLVFAMGSGVIVPLAFMLVPLNQLWGIV